MKKLSNSLSGMHSFLCVKNNLFWLTLFVLVISLAGETHAESFRSGSLSWRLLSGRTIEFTVRETINYSPFSPPAVGSIMPVTQILNWGDGNGFADVELTVKTVDVTSQSFYGEATFIHEYSTNGTFTAFIQNCCREGNIANNANGDFRMETTVTVGSGNNSPVSTLPEIVDLPVNQVNASFVVIASDSDGDPISFRLATFGETLLNALAGFSVSAAGVAQFNTTGKTVGQLWPAGLVVEDNRGGKIILNFVIRIVGPSQVPDPIFCGNGSNVLICYYGVTQCVSKKIAERYLRLGATLGGCGTKARLNYEETRSDLPVTMSLKVFPNPVQNIVTVVINSVMAGPAQLEVLDLNGKYLQRRTEELAKGANELSFDLSHEAAGGYFIRCIDSRGNQAAVRVQKE